MRKTKIVATISDRRCDRDLLSQLISSGVDIVRLNTAHMSQEGALQVISTIREISQRVAILLDTKGPEVRTGQIDEPITLKEGSHIRIRCDAVVVREPGTLWVSYAGFVHDVPVGASILLDDGSIELRVLLKHSDELLCEVRNDGVLHSRKSVNVPAVKMKLGSLSHKDEEFIKFAIQHQVDFIAHSFVRNKQDILDVQTLLDEHNSPIKIIAKIENREGVERLSEILDVAFGVMVARGDLAVEIPMYEVPLVQKRIIRDCVARGKPVITATQMLHSMIEYPRPTRAEVSDVANAVLDGTDAVMLSGETAAGKYPVEAVTMMSHIVREAEKEVRSSTELQMLSGTPSGYLARAAVGATLALSLSAIVVPTISGRSARTVAAYRPPVPILATCCEERVARELALSFGIVPSVLAQCTTRGDLIVGALRSLVQEGKVQLSDTIAMVVGAPGVDTSAAVLEIDTVARALETNDLSGLKMEPPA